MNPRPAPVLKHCNFCRLDPTATRAGDAPRVKILVLEDDKRLAGLVRQGLENRGFTVDFCDNGDDAYSLATTRSYDALVLDIMVPGRDGLSILRNLRDRRISTQDAARAPPGGARTSTPRGPVGLAAAADLFQPARGSAPAKGDPGETPAPLCRRQQRTRPRAGADRSQPDHGRRDRGLQRPRARSGGGVQRAAAILVAADQVLLVQALQNLLNNAVKYSRASGMVQVALCVADGRETLAVGNSGPGISAADRPRVFERFFRGDPARSRHCASGVGLGLSLSREILRAHGGDLILGRAEAD